MNIEVLNKLVASGKANFGTYITSAPFTIMKIDKNKGIVITKITLRSFADLPPGIRFDSLANVVNSTWHQLRVIGRQGINTFQARWDLLHVNQSPPNFFPQGEKQWNIFLNHDSDVYIELSNVGRFIPSMALTSNPISKEISVPNNPAPPYGYGKLGVPGSPAILETLTIAGTWQFRPWNTFTASNPAGIDSRTQFTLPIGAVGKLNNPQPLIPFGQYTFPIIEVEYVLINKQADWTFSKPVQI